MAGYKNGMKLIILWALVALIGRIHCKCSLTLIADDERSIAYACIHSEPDDLNSLPSETEWIEFSVSRIGHIPDNAFARFRNLKRLAFYNCYIETIGRDAFRGLNQLEWLVIHGTRLHAARADWFRHLPNLKRLILDKCELVHIEPEVFRLLPRLESLGLRDNDLDCLPIEELSTLRMLGSVRIDGNPWICECRQRLERFLLERRIVQEQECRTCLDLHENLQCMTQFVVPVLPSITIQNITSSTGLIPSGRAFETSVFSSLDRLPDKTTWIQISGLRMERIPMYGFFRFGNSLRSLEFRDCSISSLEAGAFAGLHKLERLIMIGNRFPVVRADWFRDLLALQQLILQSNEIEHFESTAFWHMARTLRHLDVRNNRLRCLPVDRLSYLKNLERVEISGNPWLCTCRDNLQKFFVQQGISFEIVGRCYHDEREIPVVDDRVQHTITTTITGSVRWGTIEDIYVNVTRPAPRPTLPPPPIVTAPPQPPPYQGSCVPDSGQYSNLFYSCSGLTSLSALSSIPYTIHTIRIIRSNIFEIPRDVLTRFRGHLVRLELQDCGISKIHDHAFYGLSNLQYLILRSNDLESITAQTVEGMTSLRHLDLSRNNILRITNGVFDVLPNLISFDISENEMNCIGVEHMALRLPHLRVFKVDGNPWSCLCRQKIASFMDDRRISYNRSTLIDESEDCLYMNMPGITTPRGPTAGTPRPPPPPPPPRIPPTTVIPTVIHNNTIEGSCTRHQDSNGLLRYRCTGGNVNLLKTIPPEANVIEFHEGHLYHLPAGYLLRFPSLRELTIWNCGLRTIEPGAFNGLAHLQKLTIRDNPLLAVGSNWFVLHNLEMLDLRGNSIKYIEPGAFKHLSKLYYLNLEGNDLKCIYTSDLDDMTMVHTIEFSGNPLKWRCRVELEQFLESQRINYVKVENSCDGKTLVRNLLFQSNNDLHKAPSHGIRNYPHSLIIFLILVCSYITVML